VRGGSLITLPHFPGLAELLNVLEFGICAIGNSGAEHVGQSRLFSDTDLVELLDAQPNIHL
jgi:hypothetical protein